ncbi:MAG TPA: SIS domain-containing protein [Kofleriaceae bacterium]|nr:SIS domain-containing protein [Kofleriaceae bacterium]
MSTLLDEIDQQPDALERLLHERRAEIKDAAAKIRAFDPAWVVIAARGSSDNAARYAQYVLGAHNRLGVALAVPSLHTIYDAPPRYARALAIGISQSGQSPDVVSVIAAAREQGGLTIAITNDPASPLAQAAEIVLALATGAERSIAATKTYTNQLMLLAMLSAAIAESHEAELEAVPGAVAAALEATGELGELALDYATAGRFVVLGRGFNYCTAHELALKMKETSYVLAEPYSSADLRHGPVAMIEYGFPVVLIAPSGKASDDTSELLELLRWRRARVIALSDRDDVLARAAAGIRLPPGVPEWLSPIVTIAPGQRFAHALATAKGLDPDRPRDLTKVTKTR